MNAHNVARQEVGVCPITWNTIVAKFAQSYADQIKADCALTHSNVDGGIYGENFLIGYTANDAVMM